MNVRKSNSLFDTFATLKQKSIKEKRNFVMLRPTSIWTYSICILTFNECIRLFFVDLKICNCLTNIYSHSQWLFYEFISDFTNKLVKQSLRVTVLTYYKYFSFSVSVFKCPRQVFYRPWDFGSHAWRIDFTCDDRTFWRFGENLCI